MRWDELLTDLEAQWQADERRDVESEIGELTVAEEGQIGLADRIRDRRGGEISLRLPDGEVIAGTIGDAFSQWVVVRQGMRDVLVPLHAVVAAWPLSTAAPAEIGVRRRLSVAHALRALARRNDEVSVKSAAGIDRGWIVKVGADHIDLRSGGATIAGSVTLSLSHVYAVISH